MLFSSVHIVDMHSFNFIKIFSFDINNRYFYCFAYWLLLSSFLVIVFVTHTCFLLQKFFLFISSSGFSCFCHWVCLRTRKSQKVLIRNFFEVLRLCIRFPSNGNRQQRAVFYLESFILISGISGFSFFAIEHIRKSGNHGKFL